MSHLKKLHELDYQAQELGFVWPDAICIIDNIISECQEIKQVFLEQETEARPREEVADMLLASWELCVFLKLAPEQLLGEALNKFSKRFEHLQDLCQEQGYTSLHQQPRQVLIELWQQAKTRAYADLETFDCQSNNININ